MMTMHRALYAVVATVLVVALVGGHALGAAAAGTPLLMPEAPSSIAGQHHQSAPSNATADSSPTQACTNNGPPPGSSYSCAQQKAWGKCSAPWMKGYCCAVCGGGGGGGGSTAQTIVTTLGCGNCHGCGLESPNSVRAHMESLFNQACDGLGCCSDERAVMLAMAMQESNDMDSTDTSKGSDKPSSNFSPFNLNAAELGELGCDMSCAQSLGQYASDYDIPRAVGYVITGLRGGTALGGACDFLNYHRDGSTGWKDCYGQSCQCDCGWGGCKAYKDAIADAANQVLQHPSYGTAGYRVCEKVPHI